MTRYETTGERPTDYSKWHRTLPDYCKTQDIDWVEYRIKDEILTPVALIETGRWARTKFIGSQISLSKTIAKKLEIPIYFVEYSINEDNYGKNIFKVKDLNKENSFRIMNNKEYSKFIMQM